MDWWAVSAVNRISEAAGLDLKAFEEIVGTYDPEQHEAPLVIGHPETDDPAYGWVGAAVLDGSLFKIAPKQVLSEFAELISAGRYKKVSISVYHPDNPDNPTPGKYSLKHVGWLGAKPPAIKGLPPIKLGEGKGKILTIELSESEFSTKDEDVENGDPFRNSGTGSAQLSEKTGGTVSLEERQRALKEKEEALEKREAAADRRDILNFVEGLCSAPDLRLPPVLKDLAVECLLGASASPEAGTIQFSESEGTTPVQLSQRAALQKLLSSYPKLIHFGEVAKGDDFVVDGSVDPKELAQQISDYRDEQAGKGKTISFSEAKAVVLGRRNQQ